MLKNNTNIYIETYGCQMNFSDSEIVASVLTDSGYHCTGDLESADVILVNTCSIRENAEDRVRKRLRFFRSLKRKRPGLVIGLLGCMAERIKTSLLEEEQLLDLIAGPDSYRHLPDLLAQIATGGRAVDVLLSSEETYADITPVRLDSNGVTAFISIMRGCENFCAYCVVPYTRGRERSRDSDSIVAEAESLYLQGYREITLLGQNVNSYRFSKNGAETDFSALLARVAAAVPGMRIRFATSHPRDLSRNVLEVMAKFDNLCKAIHLPVQSGSNQVLERMQRGYTRENYLQTVHAIREILPDCTLSTDIITGFCGETELDHLETLSLMKEARFASAFMFKYSERRDTLAADTLADDVPPEIKERRLREIIDLQQTLSLKGNRADIGKNLELLVEGVSKRSVHHLFGRTGSNKVVVFRKSDEMPGHTINVKITGATSATLTGEHTAV
jgi:tRNA-2-methylthio-N6-dimethylallyladenosine synthase